MTVATVCKETEMTKKSWFEATGILLLLFGVGCSQGAPTAPSSPAREDFGTASGSTASTTSSYPVVKLEPDLRAYPARVTVVAANRDAVWFVNNTSKYWLIRSYNCSNFSTMGLQPGASRYTKPFYLPGRTCDFYAYDEYPHKVFLGQVVVD
jgi:hypothetical protein